LNLAVQTGTVEIVRLLLKYGAYVHSACSFTFWEGYTPLCVAVQGHENIVVKTVVHLLILLWPVSNVSSV
jgi:hypothetical protein